MEDCNSPWILIQDEDICKQYAVDEAFIWGETYDTREKPTGCLYDNYGDGSIYFNKRNTSHINVLKTQYDAICSCARG